MQETIKVTYDSTNDVDQATEWLLDYSKKPMVALDFETAIKYTEDQRKQFLADSENPSLSYLDRKKALSQYKATALDHPSHTVLTHLSLATSIDYGKVIIIDSKEIQELVLDYLINVSQTQIWHNASYDFKHIYHYTGQFPKNYEDTQIYFKTLLNHVENDKSRTGLKELAGHMYGSWGISSDYFNVSQIYESKVLLYAATDACATMWLYKKLLKNVEGVQTTDSKL